MFANPLRGRGPWHWQFCRSIMTRPAASLYNVVDLLAGTESQSRAAVESPPLERDRRRVTVAGAGADRAIYEPSGVLQSYRIGRRGGDRICSATFAASVAKGFAASRSCSALAESAVADFCRGCARQRRTASGPSLDACIRPGGGHLFCDQRDRTAARLAAVVTRVWRLFLLRADRPSGASAGTLPPTWSPQPQAPHSSDKARTSTSAAHPLRPAPESAAHSRAAC